MHHPNFCFKGHKHLMDMSYMEHDFTAMWRHLKSTSWMILVDMGASCFGVSCRWKTTSCIPNASLYITSLVSILIIFMPMKFHLFHHIMSFNRFQKVCKLPIIGSMLASSLTQKANWIHCNFFLTITIKMTLLFSSWILTIRPLKCP